jgi:branched-chain amino acid transport system substrate-binding protein
MDMKKGLAMSLVFALAALASACSSSLAPIRVGAVYPLSGSQGPGGLDEYRGVRLAVGLVNADGGVDGRPVELEALDVPGADAAPDAIAELADRGIRFVLGSYGSTVSQPAAAAAADRHMLFWETGAVGSMPAPGSGGRFFFRVAPGGGVLGKAAVSFVADQLAPLWHRPASSLRFAVANVDDVYGSAVAAGAVDEIHALGLPFAGQFPYDLSRSEPAGVVRGIARAKADVLFVAAYMEDGIALRREMVRQRLPLLVNIGTSSSYCMPEFGAALGGDAVGLFASDKPDADAIDTSGLTQEARDLLERARSAFRSRYHAEMSAPALAGFSAAWALFHTVMPGASALTSDAVAAQAVRARIPRGGLPNGSGLEFSPPGATDAGANLLAATVIWEWLGVERRAVVWPRQFSTAAIRPISIAP